MRAITANRGPLVNAGFIPTSVASCQLWFDAADASTITLNGSTVSSWRDKSANEYSVIQPTSANQPTYTTNLLNGLPGIQISAATYLYQVASSIPNFSSSASTTVVMVAKNGSTLATGGWNIVNTMWFTGNINGPTYRYHLSFAIGTTNGVALYPIGQTTAVPLGSSAIIGFTLSSSGNSINVNGTLTNYSGSSAPSANNGIWFLFGDARYSIGEHYVPDINIYEFLGFNNTLSTTERQNVEGYLAQKWGLTASLPAGHPGLTTNYLSSQPRVFRIGPLPGNRTPFLVTENQPPPAFVLISNGLVSRWQLNESSGSTVIDSVGGNNITIGGSPSRVSVTYGSYTGFALSLQTTSQVGSIPNPSNMNVVAHSMTSWVYFTALRGQQRWLSWGNSGCGGGGEDFSTYLDTLYHGPTCIVAYAFLSSGLTTGVWYFCVSTYNGTTWTTYLNGTQIQSANAGFGAVNGFFSIGYNQDSAQTLGGNGGGGYLGEIRFYNRALTAAEVLRIYQGTG